MKAKAKSTKVKGTSATIYPPTETKLQWTVTYIDRITGKRRVTTGGASKETAEAKAHLLAGNYVEGWAHGEEAPTLSEAVDDYMEHRRASWSSRTFDNYSYISRRVTTKLGNIPVTKLTPHDLAAINLSELSRGQQEKTRTIILSALKHCEGWLTAPRAKHLAQSIRVSGSKAGQRNETVSRGDIPSSAYVNALIATAYHTLQTGPLDKNEASVSSVTGEKTRQRRRMKFAPGLGLGEPDIDDFKNGLPIEITSTHRRGMPKHYNFPEERRRAETDELASRYRQAGLIAALGAGGGLRIGEVLALRVRHFLTPAQVTIRASLGFFHPGLTSHPGFAYTGAVEVSEQASQASKGKIWVTGTKGSSKERTVHLPAFLPNWRGGTGTLRDQISLTHHRLEDNSVSLWEATEEESEELWREGFTPLGYLLINRLKELWGDPALKGMHGEQRVKNYRELLLFPTRNPARTTRDGIPNVMTDPGWNKSIRIVEGAGTYQAQSNYAKISNPLYDYVSYALDEWPEHRTNAVTRKGWTHHGLRHWAVSSRLQAGISLPLIAKEMGHKNAAFTLERYGHVVDQGFETGGFEY